MTIYQMELPFNTTISADILKGTGQFSEHVATWDTRRRWVREAFDALERAGYTIGSAYTAVKDPARTKFLYRDRLWQGADLVGLGVASFGHVNGVHVQNVDTWETYGAAIDRGELPLGRAYRPTRRRAADPRARPAAQARRDPARLLRATSSASTSASASRDVWRSLGRRRLPGRSDRRDRIALTREGLLRVDIAAAAASSCPSTSESDTRDTGTRTTHVQLTTTSSSSAAARRARRPARCSPSTATACCCSSASRSRATTSASR